MDILLVDDERGFLDQAKIFLERKRKEFDIYTVASAKKGLKRLEKKDFDAIISDYQMPAMDGLEFLEKIRNEKNKDLPFIIFTGKGREDVAMEALNLGADRYLQKGGSPKSQYDVLADAVMQEVKHYKTQKALDISEQKYVSITEDVLDNSDVAMFILDSDFNIAWINRSAEDYFGLDKDEVIGEDKEKLIKDEIKHKFEKPDRFERKATSAYRKNDHIEDFECHILSDEKDVEDRWLKHWSKPIETGLYEGGRMEHYTDITEKKVKEKRLEKNKNWLSQIVKSSSVPTFVIDEDHIVTHWNRACENLTGIRSKDIIGTKDSWKAFYKEDRPVMADLVLRDADEDEIEKYYDDIYTKSPLLEEAYEAEDCFENFGKNGKWVYFTAAPIKDSSGKKIGAIETLQDVSERKKKEKENEMIKDRLQEAVTRFRKISEISPFAVILIDKNTGLIKDANKAAEDLLGCNRENIISKNYLELHPEGEKEIMKEVINNEDSTELSFSREFHINRFDSDEVPVEIMNSTVQFGDDDVEYFALKDITFRKKMREREDFLHSILRHDVKNKTQVIHGYLKLIREYDMPEEAKDYIIKSIKASEEGLDIINKVKTMSNLKRDIELEDIELCSVIDKVIEANEVIFEEKEIETECEKKEIHVKGDPLIEELFSNIIENAIKHADCNLLKFSAKELENKVEVKIEDDGKGITNEIKNKLFKRGYKSGGTAGSGLGLYIVKKIVESYDGNIEVRDSEFGGACFVVSFKKYNEQEDRVGA